MSADCLDDYVPLLGAHRDRRARGRWRARSRARRADGQFDRRRRRRGGDPQPPRAARARSSTSTIRWDVIEGRHRLLRGHQGVSQRAARRALSSCRRRLRDLPRVQRAEPTAARVRSPNSPSFTIRSRCRSSTARSRARTTGSGAAISISRVRTRTSGTSCSRSSRGTTARFSRRRPSRGSCPSRSTSSIPSIDPLSDKNRDLPARVRSRRAGRLRHRSRPARSSRRSRASIG